MVTILDKDGLESFKQRLDTTETILIPIFTDEVAHPCNNRLSLLYVRFFGNGDEYVIPYDHSEATPLNESFDGRMNKFVLNRKALRHNLPLSKVIDINLLQYVDSGVPTTLCLADTKAHSLIKRNFPNYRNLNRIIPLSKHVEACRVLSSKMQEVVEKYRLNLDDPAFQFLNFSATDVFQQIERSGIHVEKTSHRPEFTRHISDANLMYSEYNFFTTTGRPSNRFGGVNFAAMNKEDGSRAALTSRFGKDGLMVLIDYDAYHLRLIAELIGFKFPPGNVHEYLGKMYFNTETLTKEQYEESKRLSFHMLYGGIQDEYKHVPFFAEVQKFVDYLWTTFSERGYIVSPIGQKKLYKENMFGMHPQKLFSYLIQLHETEHNVMTLERVLPMFYERDSKIVLYTYDSFLIDIDTSKPDWFDFLAKVKKALECENTYPTKVYSGYNYHEMTNVTDRFHIR